MCSVNGWVCEGSLRPDTQTLAPDAWAPPRLLSGSVAQGRSPAGSPSRLQTGIALVFWPFLLACPALKAQSRHMSTKLFGPRDAVC